MKKWNTIIFDMDGTLFDTEQISRLAWLEYGKQKDLPVTEEFILSLIGRSRQSAQVMIEKYMPSHFDEDDAFHFIHQYMREYKSIHGPLPKTDLKQLLTQLKSRGYKIALCSSSGIKPIEMNLNYVGIMEDFDVIVNGTMVSNGKPAPDIYLLTAEKLGVQPNECLVIEDSKNGIISGHEAGMDVIMVVDMIEPDDELRNICLEVFHQLDEILTLI